MQQNQACSHQGHTIIMARPMNVGRAELYCFRLVRLSVRGCSNSLIFNLIYSKFHIWIASINLSFKFEYGFCLPPDNQDG